MTSLIVILTFLSFLQGAFLPFDLVILVLIARSYVIEERLNYWLAFSFGLLISFLLGQPIGVLSVIYLVAVKMVYIIRRTSFAAHWLTIIPITLAILLIIHFLEKIFFGISFNYQDILLQVILSFPIYLIVRFLSERFIPKNDIRLRIGK